MEIEKGMTYKYLRDKIEVTQETKDNMKEYGRIKKSILNALSEGDLTIDQLSAKLDMPRDKMVFYLMSLIKYGFVQTSGIDDMDEYFMYKIKNNG